MYQLLRKGSVAGVVVTALIMSIVFGVVVASRWETFLLYFNRVPFGVADPSLLRTPHFI